MEAKNAQPKRQRDTLSRQSITKAAIAVLDSGGEKSFTIRTLAASLHTGAGALYWHVKDKRAVLDLAADSIVKDCLDVVANIQDATNPTARIRVLSLELYEAIDHHPWLGPQLTTNVDRQPSTLLALDMIGQQLSLLGIETEQQFYIATALLNYVIGVGVQMSQARFSLPANTSRDAFLQQTIVRLERLNATKYPFMTSSTKHLLNHDDRRQFSTGLDLMLATIKSLRQN